jgi:hypothetical protein
MKPSGELYLDEEAKIQKKYKNNPEVLEDIKILQGLLQAWHMHVFTGILQTMTSCPECTKLTEVMRKLDGFESVEKRKK